MCVVVLGVLGIDLGAAFGYARTGSQATADRDESTSFTVYLQGRNETVRADVRDAPAGWAVAVMPDRIRLPPQEHFVHRRTPDGYVKMARLTVHVEIPGDAPPGQHAVSIQVEGQRHPAPSHTNLQTQQVQPFTFHVYVPEPAQYDGEIDTPTGDIAQGDQPAHTEGGLYAFFNRLSALYRHITDFVVRLIG